jgi:hypothetical protein
VLFKRPKAKKITSFTGKIDALLLKKLRWRRIVSRFGTNGICLWHRLRIFTI